MPVNTYEFLILLDTGKISSDPDAAKEQLQNYVKKVGGEVMVGRVWEERRLAYPIQNQKKGLFYLMYAAIESTKVAEIEAEFRLNEFILRYMVIKIHPKWADTMLAIGRDERGMAYHAMTDDDSGIDRLGEPVGAGAGGDGEGGRRGPRRSPEGESKE